MKEGGEKPQAARMADKEGWLKKSGGGLLGLWKDRYLLLCQAQLLVCESEDEQKCVETVELGSYEKCQDLRALLKRRHRFILLRSPGNKVSDIKFQAPSGEEKESWIRALNEGINRGKNKAFDEVKVDKTCALEHVTRDRVRGGQRRRPPTRVHLKEVANAASDGLSRLDLDVPNSRPSAFVPNQEDDAVAPPREKPQPLMPPTKLSPAPQKASLGDLTEPSAGERAPSPEALPNNLGDEGAAPEDPSIEPRSGVLPDKLKVSWENPSPEKPPTLDSANGAELLPGSSPEQPEAAPKEAGKSPPVPPPKILSKKLRASIRGIEASGTSETSAPEPVPVNGVSDEPLEPCSAPKDPGTSPPDAVTPPDAAAPPVKPPMDPEVPCQPRCSSMGDLLKEVPRDPRQRLFRAQLGVQAASEQTEKLLDSVLSGGPAPPSTKTLLSQAVEQLRQASQALQEMGALDGLHPETQRKELVTLYRRSAP